MFRIFKGRGKSTEVDKKDKEQSLPSEATAFLERKLMYLKIHCNTVQ